LRREFDLDLQLVPFELRPDAPPEGLTAPGNDLGHSERVEQRLHELAERAGHPLVLTDLVPNTHLAIALGEFARDLGPEVHRAAHAAIFHAYYGEGRDIGDREVLLDVARAVGLDAGEVGSAFDDGRYDERIHEYAHVAMHLGIDSTPSALICNELVIGSRPYGVLREAVLGCLITPETIEHEHAARGA
jgi:predicted DsbA family dithiol-disulfide isomerase